MRVLYLQHADYEAFGLPDTTTPDKIAGASALVNAWLNRPEGLLCSDGATMDATGEPITEYGNVSASGLFVLTRVPVGEILEISWAIMPHGSWSEASVAEAHIEHWTGRVTPPLSVPRGARLCVKYVAGWTYGALPDIVKQATALVVQSGVDLSGVPRGVKRARAGDSELEFFGGSQASPLFAPDVAAALAPYRRMAA